MDQRVRNYLIRAHDKVITHYQQVLQLAHAAQARTRATTLS